MWQIVRTNRRGGLQSLAQFEARSSLERNGKAAELASLFAFHLPKVCFLLFLFSSDQSQSINLLPIFAASFPERASSGQMGNSCFPLSLFLCLWKLIIEPPLLVSKSSEETSSVKCNFYDQHETKLAKSQTSCSSCLTQSAQIGPIKQHVITRRGETEYVLVCFVRSTIPEQQSQWKTKRGRRRADSERADKQTNKQKLCYLSRLLWPSLRPKFTCKIHVKFGRQVGR